MNTSQHLTDKLDEISCDKAIFSDRLYRKINNTDNTYSVYRLDFKNNSFVWEKIYNFLLPEGHECISFDNLVYHKGAMRLGLENSTDCITIYMCPTDGIATKEMIYKGDNLLIWNIFNQGIELDESLSTDSLLNLPTHVDLIQEAQNYPEECQTDNYDSYELIDNFIDSFEPLHGWDNLLERSSDISDNDLGNDEDIPDNFNYPDDEDYSDNIKDNVTELDELDEVNEEYRIDPYDGELYSKSEFLEYYGGETEWNHQSPKNILLREEYYKFTTTFGQLSDKKFMYLLKKYEKTFNQ